MGKKKSKRKSDHIENVGTSQVDKTDQEKKTEEEEDKIKLKGQVGDQQVDTVSSTDVKYRRVSAFSMKRKSEIFEERSIATEGKRTKHDDIDSDLSNKNNGRSESNQTPEHSRREKSPRNKDAKRSRSSRRSRENSRDKEYHTESTRESSGDISHNSGRNGRRETSGSRTRNPYNERHRDSPRDSRRDSSYGSDRSERREASYERRDRGSFRGTPQKSPSGAGREVRSYRSKHKFVKHEKEFIMVMDHGSSFCFHGKVQMKVLSGQIEVLGYVIKEEEKFYSLFSPESSNSLKCKAVKPKEHTNTVTMMESYFGEKYKDTAKKICDILKTDSVVILLRKHESIVFDFIETVSPFKNIFGNITQEDEQEDELPLVGLGITEKEDNYDSTIIFGYECTSAAEEILEFQNATGKAPVLMMCGGKNVGKSTLSRYIVNRLLQRFGKVGFLECDVGQTEFTPPGCVAFNIVTEPLFGPPFTHQKTSERLCFTGALSPGDDPEHYHNCVKHAHSAYEPFKEIVPLVVNTMGWNKGLGLSFFVDTFKLIQPDFVVQLDSQSQGRNFPPVTKEFIKNTPGWVDNEITDLNSNTRFKGHKLLQIPSHVQAYSSSAFKPVDFRDLALLAYISDLPDCTEKIESFNSIRPYKVPWSSVAVHVCHTTVPNSQIMYAMNASIVGLCAVDESLIVPSKDASLPKFLSRTPVSDCIGIGVVRAIDPVEKVYYIMTPVPEEKLKQVNCLLRGAIDLPQQILLSQESVGPVPYIGQPKDVIGATSIKKRRHLQRRSYGAPQESS